MNGTRRVHPTMSGAVAGTITFISIGIAGFASAVEDPVEALAETMRELSPTGAPQLEITSDADGTFQTVLIDGGVTLPVTADGALEFSDIGMRLELPEKVAGNGSITNDGLLLYAGEGGDTPAAIKNDGTGVEIQTLLPDAGSTQDLEHELVPVLRADGGVDIVRGDKSGSLVSPIIATIDAPWAIDADGQAVPTRYEVRGGAVAQIVDVDDSTSFPVLADPRVSVGTGIYVALSRVEIRSLATAAGTLLGGAAAASCAILADKVRAPGVKNIVTTVCGYTTLDKALSFIRSLPSRAASHYTASCYQARIPAQSPAWKVVASSQC